MGRRRRFYKANLPTVIWNTKVDKALVRFVGGEFTTDDPKIVQILISKGYPEVKLDALEPPDFRVEKGHSIEGDVKVMPPGYNESAALNKQKTFTALNKAKTRKPEKSASETKPKRKRKAVKRRAK